MPLSSMGMVATFFAVAQCANDKFSQLENCINKSSTDITALQPEATNGAAPLQPA
jgi:hypothetical protein